MALEQEFIPSLEIPLTPSVGESAVLSWDVTELQIQLGATVVSVAWSIENTDILSLGGIGNVGNVFFATVTALEVGCSHLIANITLDDGNQTPTLKFIEVFVIEPKCSTL